MNSRYNIEAVIDFTGSLVCKGCSDKYCVTVKDGKSLFCPSYCGSIYNGKDKKFKVQCDKQ